MLKRYNKIRTVHQGSKRYSKDRRGTPGFEEVHQGSKRYTRVLKGTTGFEEVQQR